MKKIIFGLGNPGKQYQNTRHNLGIEAAVVWYEQAAPEIKNKVYLIRPSLPMNSSGQTLVATLKYYDVTTTQVLVIHDDIELPLGKTKLTFGGSAKGHNGIRSIYNSLKNQDVYRLRIGVGRPFDETDIRDFVLSKFNQEEINRLNQTQKQINYLITEFVTSPQNNFSENIET